MSASSFPMRLYFSEKEKLIFCREEMSVTLNMGFVMPAWYDIIGLSIDSKQDEPGILKACKDCKFFFFSNFYTKK